jgi:hypothetical protein
LSPMRSSSSGSRILPGVGASLPDHGVRAAPGEEHGIPAVRGGGRR